ncbi:tetratricopeptide repeat protein [Crenobacter sp. SG2303]|uniref:Tetratricopeptide repeat protein n=2 Tax=Crenobacter oryzisoli TaxID=3056844 RepID=A0ABT7XSC0_9NEIS|nr:tetratricopeptide repeat protein [Crenobacter sp. SG2303]MDN0076625.1 tetratricopeptide repeat protein [Crenobacter sp. SG2303]
MVFYLLARTAEPHWITMTLSRTTLSRTLPLLLVCLLAACAQFSPATSGKPTASTEEAAREAADAKAKAEAEAKLPKVELTDQLLYGVVASEIAAQRGVPASSALTYLELARQTRDPRMAQRAAEFAMVSGQLKIATDALKLWVELDPSSALAREQLFIVLLRTGKLAESRPLIDDLLQREPQRAGAIFIQLARLTLRQGDKQGGVELVKELAARYPKLPEAHFALIAVASEANDQATIDAEFDKLAVLAPKWDLPVAWETDRLRRSDQNAAIAFLKRELDRRPDASFELKLAYPRLLVSARRFDEALVAFQALLKNDPKNPDLLFAVGLLSYQLNDFPNAERSLKGALDEHYPDADFLRYTLGQLAEERDRVAEAREWFQKVGHGPQYLAAQARLAELDAKEGRLDQGLNRLAGIGHTEQERNQLAIIGAQIAIEVKQPQRAYQLLSNALVASPKAPELLYQRSMVSEQLGNFSATERDLRAYLHEKPNDPQGLNALGYTLAIHTTRYKEAHSYIARALKQEPDNPTILDSMGWVQYKLGHLESAQSYLQRAFALLPDPEVAAHLGEVLFKRGHVAEAREVWAKGKAIDPQHQVLNETMHRLGGE